MEWHRPKFHLLRQFTSRHDMHDVSCVSCRDVTCRACRACRDERVACYPTNATLHVTTFSCAKMHGLECVSCRVVT